MQQQREADRYQGRREKEFDVMGRLRQNYEKDSNSNNKGETEEELKKKEE